MVLELRHAEYSDHPNPNPRVTSMGGKPLIQGLTLKKKPARRTIFHSKMTRTLLLTSVVKS
eukprot:1115899-Amorphochlora_amoeboformis.AAC.1